MKRIIIADDSGTARMFIKRCFEISGCQDVEFLEAGNGVEALEQLKKTSVDLVVSDLHMPEMDGAELLKRIKSSPRFHETPVIIISSAANPKKVEELKALLALDVLSKPVSPASVSKAIKPLLKNSEK
ncbi:MAG: response regulator [Deltaproteobacteria bacterium]|nr:MAG: response regulator [Deltaproteobacteria bacterium]